MNKTISHQLSKKVGCYKGKCNRLYEHGTLLDKLQTEAEE
jgi:hypothetical protein